MRKFVKFDFFTLTVHARCVENCWWARLKISIGFSMSRCLKKCDLFPTDLELWILLNVQEYRKSSKLIRGSNSTYSDVSSMWKTIYLFAIFWPLLWIFELEWPWIMSKIDCTAFALHRDHAQASVSIKPLVFD